MDVDMVVGVDMEEEDNVDKVDLIVEADSTSNLKSLNLKYLITTQREG